MTIIAALIQMPLKQGSDIDDTWTLLDSTGAVVPLTGFTGRAELRSKPKDKPGSAILATATVTVTDAPNGIWRYLLRGRDTAALDFTLYRPKLYSHVELYTTGDDQVWRVLEYVFTIGKHELEVTG